MNIGFFGDSYVDLIWHRYPAHSPPEHDKPWSLRLLEHYHSPIITSGIGGSNQYHAIKLWQDFQLKKQPLDYAIFTFTWRHRLYHYKEEYQKILYNWTERRQLGNLTSWETDFIQSIDGYYTFLESYDQVDFLYELQLKWILDLPEQYPDTKFIFIPNTEYARTLAKTHFKKGILLDFAFETISENEGELVGQGEFVETKYGHLMDQNHERFKNKMIDIIDKKVYNTVIPINYEDYKL